MGATRQRFKPAEREVFVKDAEIEWLHVNRWRPGRIATGVIQTDSIGMQYLDVIDAGPTTRTITGGAAIRGYPKHLRLRKSCSCGEAWADEPGHDTGGPVPAKPGEGGTR